MTLRRAAIALCVLALGALALSACGGGSDEPSSQAETTVTAAAAVVEAGSDAVEAPPMLAVDPPLDVSGVTLPDVATGAASPAFTMKARPGGVLLVFFGYTYCPDVCPTTLGTVKEALAKLGDAPVDVAFVTVDLQRDTPEVLNGYLGHFLTSYHALRAPDEDALLAAEEPFGAGHTFVGDTSTPGYTVDHTAGLYVVDDQGQAKGIFAYGVSPEQIVDGVTGVLGG